MARTHSVLRAEASRLTSPGEILSRANDLLVPGDAGTDVRDLPVRGPRPGDRPHRHRQRRPQPAVRAQRRRYHRAARHRHAAGPAARHPLRGDRGGHRTRQQRPALQRRTRRGPRRRTREMFGFDRLREALAGRRRRQRAAGPAARDAPRVHRARTTSRRTTSRWSRCVARPAWHEAEPDGGGLQRADLVQSARRSRATSARRWTAWPPPWPTSACRRTAWSG